MCGFTAGSRSIDVMGTLGEIKGNLDENYIKVLPFGEKPIKYHAEDLLDGISMEYDPYGHGGGDKRLIRDLINLIKENGETSSSLTTLERSLESHYAALAAEESRVLSGRPVELEKYMSRFHSL